MTHPQQMNLKILSQEERNLMQAVHVGDIKKTSKLITEDKVDVNIQDVLMRAPLLRTCYLQSRETRGTLAKLLLKSGADVNITDRHGRTALMTACMESDGEDLVKVFFAAKTIDTNARDENGSTALMHAVHTDNVESVRTLLTWKPPPARKSEKLLVDLGDYEGIYPLLLAAKQQNPDICEILVKDGGANYSEIPKHLKKYLPPECRGSKRKPLTNDPFEKYRHQAQDILNTPFRPPMVLQVDPTPFEELENVIVTEKDTETNKSFPWMTAMAVTRYRSKNDKNQGKTESAADIPVGEVVCITPAQMNVDGTKSPENKQLKPPAKKVNPNKDERPKSPAKDVTPNKDERPKSPAKENPKKDERPKSATKENHKKDERPKSAAKENLKKGERPKSAAKENLKKDERPKSPEASENKPKDSEQSRPDSAKKEAKETEKKDPVPEEKKQDQPTEDPKPKDDPPPKDDPKPKPKGGWVAEPEELAPTPEPTHDDPFPPLKPKKKGPAYKTKSGRKIHPNTKRNQHYQKQAAGKPAGGSSKKGVGGGKPPAK